MRTIPVTYYLRPHGRIQLIELPLASDELVARCEAIIKRGFGFTVERVGNNSLHFCIEGPDPKTGEMTDLATTIIDEDVKQMKEAVPRLLTLLSHILKEEV